MKTKTKKTKTIITLTTVPWRRHCDDWSTACLKHALRDWTFQLYCWNVLWYSSELVLSSSGRLARLGIHFCPRSPLIWFPPQPHRCMLNTCSALCGDLTACKRNRIAIDLERRIFLRMNFNNLNPENSRESLIITADFNSGPIWFWAYDDDNDMKTITSNFVSVQYTALLLLLVSNSK